MAIAKPQRTQRKAGILGVLALFAALRENDRVFLTGTQSSQRHKKNQFFRFFVVPL
jgi:hypothetical protein